MKYRLKKCFVQKYIFMMKLFVKCMIYYVNFQCNVKLKKANCFCKKSPVFLTFKFVMSIKVQGGAVDH